METTIQNPVLERLNERIKKSKTPIMWSGIGLIFTGVLSLFFPFIATASITYFVAILFFVTGLFTFINSFSISGTGPFFGSLLMGLLKIACGTIIFFNPIIGMLYLTSLIAFLFAFEGAFEMAFAFELKPEQGWVWCLISSIISIFSSILIIATLGTSSLWLVGLIFGFNTLSTGASLFLLSRNI